ncbi:outer membrane lipoprotein-sorting protein [Thermophagus sp. OGC60D27]|uniref:outer membrane lipoprotein-sorting protein n=1 Tax=Thermophagus sp. OGC60D27 TaxID=3458415 RepID=UPI0040382779
MNNSKSGFKIYYLSVLLLLLLLSSSVSSQQLSATDIVKRANDLMQGKSNYSEMEMQIIRPSWTRTLRFRAWAKGDDFSLVYIDHPPREKGQRFLKREREMWNYVPAIDRMIKIPPSMMMQSWMGSDLTNDDLVNAASIVNDYDHEVLRTETLRGYDCYVIKMVPHEDAPVVWGKVLSWISKDGFITLRNEYYDETEELVNEEILDEIEDVGDRTIPTRYTMIPVDKEGYKTSLKFQKIKFEIEVDDAFFSIRNMKQMR